MHPWLRWLEQSFPGRRPARRRRRWSPRYLCVERLETRCTPAALPLPGASSGAVSDLLQQAGLRFEANAGQADPAFNFVAHGPGYAVGLGPTGAVLGLESLASVTAGSPPAGGQSLGLSLVGSDPAAQGQGLAPLQGVSNYLNAGDPSGWQTNLANFGQVSYHKVYSGIDLVYHGNGQQLEYDFNVAAGADANAIRLRFDGTTGVETDAQGDLLLQMAGGVVTTQAPTLYQTIDGVRHSVSGAYQVFDDGTVGFTVGAYDPTQTLVIDPIVVYSTYFGGSGNDYIDAVTSDASGAV